MFSHFLRKILPFTWARPRADIQTTRRAGRYWHLLPEARGLFGPDGPDLEGWIADGRATVVKHALLRTVYRVALPGGTVYVKHCRVGGPRAWAREVLRPAKARLEFENALALRQRGIAAIASLGWGCQHPRWPGESFLLTLGQDDAVPFLHFLERVLPTFPSADRIATRRQVAHELGRFMARMHDAGVAHPDPHPGNLLIELPPSRVPHFALIDVHAVRFGAPLTWAESRANLVLYNRWFQLRSTRADRLRFWLSYLQARTSLAPLVDRAGAAWAREVERRTHASNLRFWAGRECRCLGTNRYFRKLRAGDVRGFAVRDLPEETLQPLLTDPDAVFTRSSVKLLKDSRTSTVAELTMPSAEGPRAVVFKRFRIRRWWEPLKNLFRRSAALRSWVAGHSLRERWLPTPRPLLVLHRARFGVPTVGYLLVEKVAEALDLPEAVAGLGSFSKAERRYIGQAWLERLARLVQTLHERGGSHRDLKASNLLMEGARIDGAVAKPVFIDLVGVRTGGPIPMARRAKELARLNASFLRSPLVTNTIRLRFLRLYLRTGGRKPDDWKRWWAAIREATSAKVAKNRRSGRPLA